MNFYAGQSGDLSAAGFESSSNSLPPIASNQSSALIGSVAGSVCALLPCPCLCLPACLRLCVCPAKTCVRPSLSLDHKKHVPDRLVDALTASVEMAIAQPPVKRMKIYPPDRGQSRLLPLFPDLTRSLAPCPTQS